jgi:hypothetical protein
MLEAVSCHAVIRYLERVLGLPVAEWLRGKDHLSENLKVEHCCEQAGLPVAAVRLSMLTPAVIRQMQRCDPQKAKVITSDGIFVVVEGRVITVLSPHMRAYRKKKYKPHKSRQLAEV